MLVTSIAFKYKITGGISLPDEIQEYGSKISIPISSKKEAHKHLQPIFEQIKIYFKEAHNMDVLSDKPFHITYYTREEYDYSEIRRYEIAGEFFAM